MENEACEVPSVIAFDGTVLHHLGDNIYAATQLYKSELAYLIRVSVFILLFLNL